MAKRKVSDEAILPFLVLFMILNSQDKLRRRSSCWQKLYDFQLTSVYIDANRTRTAMFIGRASFSITNFLLNDSRLFFDEVFTLIEMESNKIKFTFLLEISKVILTQFGAK